MSNAWERARGMKLPTKKPAVWAGPESDTDNGGITFSLLSRFLCCRERFRLLVVEGLKPREEFNHRLEYGNMWHLCEEAFASENSHFGEYVGTTLLDDNLKDYVRELCQKYPTQQEQVFHWYNVCKVQFPLYAEHWSKHPDVTNREPLMSEEVFHVPYALPSGRLVYLRGKWDSVDLVLDKRKTGAWLQENKTKGDITPHLLQRQLTFDLQTMLYVVAYTTWQNLDDYGCPIRTSVVVDVPLRGVRYNVIRRPLSGGKGTIVRHKGSKNKPEETKEVFYRRLAQYIKDDPDHFFMRWNVEITPQDIEAFRRKSLDPILEQLCDWWDWVKMDHLRPFDGVDGNRNKLHFIFPYGVWNPLMEGASTEYDELLVTGSEVGLARTEELFPELY